MSGHNNFLKTLPFSGSIAVVGISQLEITFLFLLAGRYSLQKD